MHVLLLVDGANRFERHIGLLDVNLVADQIDECVRSSRFLDKVYPAGYCLITLSASRADYLFEASKTMMQQLASLM